VEITMPDTQGPPSERLRRGGPFNPPDPVTFYGGDAWGYTDWPTLDAGLASA
jgi:hypothetical protein